MIELRTLFTSDVGIVATRLSYKTGAALISLLAMSLLSGCLGPNATPALRTEPWYQLKHKQNVENVVTYQPRALKMLADRKHADDLENKENFEAMEERRRLGLAYQHSRGPERSRDPGKFSQQLKFTFFR